MSKNYCLDEGVCKSCPNYHSTNNANVWICKKYSTRYKRKTVRVGGKWKYENDVMSGMLHGGMKIPKICDRFFEHTVITQEMDKIE